MSVRTRLAALLAALMLSAAAFAADPPAHAAEPAGGGPAAGHDGHGEPNLFAGGLGNAIITLIIFGTVLVVLGQKAWPQLLRVLNEREHQIRGALEDARRERLAAEKLLADYKRQIDKAREEATAIVEEGRRDAEVVSRRIQDEARQEAGETLERAKREIALARDTAVKELYDQAAEVAVRVAAGVIRKELRAEDHRALVSESLARMKASSN
jgi:F-type H+-transporting ATPase subunit b